MLNARNYLRTLRNSSADLRGAIWRGAERERGSQRAEGKRFPRTRGRTHAFRRCPRREYENTNPFGGVK